MEESKHTSRRLTKKPPASHARNLAFESRIDNSSLSLRSQHSSGSLQRAPSAPYPRAHNLSSGHVRTATSPSPACVSRQPRRAHDESTLAAVSELLHGRHTKP